MNINYKLTRDSELSEDQIEADVASFLGYITPFWSRRFQLRAVDEQETGSDRLFDKFVPIYLQFKVSEGLKPLALQFPLSSPYRPLQRVRSFRRKNNINTDPTLYFRIRDKAPTARDFQHNILKSFHRPPQQFALYIAPLTLSAVEYDSLLNTSLLNRLFTFDPFMYRDEMIFTSNSRQYLGLNPFLRGHVSIPPHEEVRTSKHYYSYSKSGSKIAWHRGEKLKGDYRLSTQIKKIFQLAYNNNQVGFENKVDYVKFINEFLKSTDQPGPEGNLNLLDDTIIEFAYFLKRRYNIKLMLLEIINSR